MYLTPSRRWRKIEQIPYAPVRAGADFAPTDPVLFPVNGVLGISISKALAEEYEGLVGRDDGVSAFERCKVTCRLQVGRHHSSLHDRISPTLSLVRSFWSVWMHSKNPHHNRHFLYSYTC